MDMPIVQPVQRSMEFEILCQIAFNFRMWSNASRFIQFNVIDVLYERVVQYPQHYRKMVGVDFFCHLN